MNRFHRSFPPRPMPRDSPVKRALFRPFPSRLHRAILNVEGTRVRPRRDRTTTRTGVADGPRVVGDGATRGKENKFFCAWHVCLFCVTSIMDGVSICLIAVSRFWSSFGSTAVVLSPTHRRRTTQRWLLPGNSSQNIITSLFAWHVCLLS